MIMSFSDLAKHGLKIRGIIHLGAHTAEEYESYASLTDKVIWFEANQDLYQKIVQTTKNNPGHRIVMKAVSDYDGTGIFRLVNHDYSSSLLPLLEHKRYYPSYVEVEQRRVPVTRLDTFFHEERVSPNEFNFLAMDIQGGEACAIRGCGEMLKHIDYIYTEVNEAELYKGCMILPEFDRLLAEKGFVRRETKMYPEQWGDAFYTRFL